METLNEPARILLVEENRDHVDRLAAILNEGLPGEYVVENVTDYNEALQRMKQKPPALLLYDIGLRNGHGEEGVRIINEAAPTVPVIVLMGTEDQALGSEVLETDAFDYLIKGFPDREPLLRIIRNACEQYRLRCQLDDTLRQLQRMSFVDPLPGLYNRRGIERSLLREVHRAGRAGTRLLVLLVDLDNFRRITESLGQGVGDMVLKRAAERIENAVRRGDEVGRAGDDQFLVLLPQTRPAEGMIIAERIRLSIAQDLIKIVGKTVRMTGSIGLTTMSPQTISITEALAKAHVALHRAKTLGKNRIACAVESPGANFTEPVVVTEDMVRTLLYDDVLEVASQSIVSLDNGTDVSRELLIRGPDGPLHRPDQLFRFSVENDILTPIDLRCLKKCVAAAKLDTSMPGYNHINIMPSTLLETPTEELMGLLRGKADATQYCLEISEQQLLGDPSYLAPTIKKLQGEGVKFAIDDVGFGHSCLESLVLLRPQIMKIDKKMIIGVGKDNSMRRLLRRLLQVADVLETEVIAEGIETADDLEVLKDLGVRLGQGYYFGKPEMFEPKSEGIDLVGAPG